MYNDVAKKVANMGENMQKQNLVLLQSEIENRIAQLNNDISNGIIRDCRVVASEVSDSKRNILKAYGFRDSDIHDAFMYVPDIVVRNIANGNIYQDGWRLSEAIWGYNKQVQYNLNRIVANGTAQGKSAYEIALQLENYVAPQSKKASKTISSWRLARETDVQMGRATKVGERIHDKFYFGNVDYNAQRLARTMVSHAYQQAFQIVNEKDPFVIGYRWLTSNFHGRVCQLCIDRATKDQYGLGAGVFPKDQLPLDHPNGMCTFEAVMPDSMEDIADKIGKWYEAPIGTYKAIDDYALTFMG